MTKSQCYAEIAQKQSEIANYNTKIEKLNSEILELNQVKSSISSLQGSFSECKNSGTSKLENTGAVQKINSKFTSKFYEGMHDLYNGAAFWNASSGLDKAIERVALEITRKQDEIAGCNQAEALTLSKIIGCALILIALIIMSRKNK